jgi:hypothetical protein
MPRGNDAEAASAELADKFSEGKGNAENLIDANNAAHPLELIQASGKKVDDEATAELDIDSLSGPNGEEVLDAAVRGGATVIVYEDESGRVQKALLDDGDDEKKTSKSSRSRNKRAKVSDSEASEKSE